jgi:hypothetical protein
LALDSHKGLVLVASYKNLKKQTKNIKFRVFNGGKATGQMFLITESYS